MRIAVITARWQSERFPGKMLADICGQPMLQHIIDRLWESQVDDVVVATTLSSDPIIDYCRANYIPHYIGSEEDILSRIYNAADGQEGDRIIRIWGDCPLINPDDIDSVLEMSGYSYIYFKGKAKGLGFAIITLSKLKHDYETLTDPQDRHWYHNYCLRQDGILTIGEYESDINYSVDTQEDLERIREIVRNQSCV